MIRQDRGVTGTRRQDCGMLERRGSREVETQGRIDSVVYTSVWCTRLQVSADLRVDAHRDRGWATSSPLEVSFLLLLLCSLSFSTTCLLFLLRSRLLLLLSSFHSTRLCTRCGDRQILCKRLSLSGRGISCLPRPP